MGKAAAVNRLGLAMTVLATAALAALPFTVYRANRIVEGRPRDLFAALPAGVAATLVALVTGALLLSMFSRRPSLRLGAAAGALAALAVAVGLSAGYAIPPEAPFARVAPGAGFWLLMLALALIVVDALERLRFGPVARLLALAATAAAVALLLASGAWDDLSFLKEYANRADSFWREGGRHLLLVFGSLSAAIVDRVAARPRVPPLAPAARRRLASSQPDPNHSRASRCSAS